MIGFNEGKKLKHTKIRIDKPYEIISKLIPKSKISNNQLNRSMNLIKTKQSLKLDKVTILIPFPSLLDPL